jgi:hypothetical protein
MTRAEVIFPALIFAVVATLLVLGNVVYEYSWTTFAFPLGAGLILCALCAAEIATTLRAHPSRLPEASVAGVTAVDAPAPISPASLAWTFALAAFLYGFGFVAGPALYLLTCLRANGASWAVSAGIALASIVVTWGLFIKAMGVLLPLKPLWLG